MHLNKAMAFWASYYCGHPAPLQSAKERSGGGGDGAMRGSILASVVPWYGVEVS